MPESDISVVDINRQQRELQRIERSAKRKFVRGNPRKQKMKMLMSVQQTSDARMFRRANPSANVYSIGNITDPTLKECLSP